MVNKQSKIIQIIDEIDDFVASCKPAAFSQSNIVVNRDQIESLIEELRKNTPSEIKEYQRLIINQEDILNKAHKDAEAIIAKAQETTTKLVSQEEIMKQAYVVAQQTVDQAQAVAQQTVDQAAAEANKLRADAVNYIDEVMALIEQILSRAIDSTKNYSESHLKEMDDLLSVVSRNRSTLTPRQ